MFPQQQIIVLTPEQFSAAMREIAQKTMTLIKEEFAREIPNMNLTVSAPDDLIPRETVMSMLDVSAKTLKNWENDRTLVPVRHGHLVFYRRSDLLKKEEKRKKH